ncbi:MAG: hypothetical protein EOM73_03645 [Bacteroidia bacterium]|nr:hypothetical protein [Bacteroidia bacterium]
MNKKERTDLLSAFCILTFIGSSIGFVLYFLAALFFEEASEIIIRYSSWHTVEKISPLYFTIFMAMYAVSLSGAIRMWKQHRDGLFLYISAQLTIMFLPVIWINSHSFSTTNAVFSAVFITGYLWHWRWLK